MRVLLQLSVFIILTWKAFASIYAISITWFTGVANRLLYNVLYFNRKRVTGAPKSFIWLIGYHKFLNKCLLFLCLLLKNWLLDCMLYHSLFLSVQSIYNFSHSSYSPASNSRLIICINIRANTRTHSQNALKSTYKSYNSSHVFTFQNRLCDGCEKVACQRRRKSAI